MGEAIKRAGDKVVIGWIALTEPEMRDFKASEAEEHIRRIEKVALHPPEFRYELQAGGIGADPPKNDWLKAYAGCARRSRPSPRTRPDSVSSTRFPTPTASSGTSRWPSRS